MRIALVLITAPLLVAANEPAAAPAPLPAPLPADVSGAVPALDNPAYTSPPQAWRTIEDAVASIEMPERQADPRECQDQIAQARAASGQPPLLEREPASPDKPHAIYAVDRRQDGCSVMVMMGNADDIRPLPAPMDGPLQVIPADTRAGK